MFVKPEVIAESMKEAGLSSVDYTNAENHVDNNKLVVGAITRNTVRDLLQDGDISTHQQTTFYKAVKAFRIRAVEYLLKWCPLEDELLSMQCFLA